MEFHIRSVPVIEVSGEGDFATNTNLSLSSRDIDHRNRIDINCSFGSSLATIFVHQDNAEVVRIISVRSGQSDGILVFASSEGAVKGGIVLIPSEGVRSRRSRIDIGNHHDIVVSVTANDRISFDSKRRVRSNRDRVSEVNSRFATSSSLLDRNFIHVDRRIIADSVRSLSEDRVNSVRNNFTISVPSVNLTTSNTTSNVSVEGHRATVAQRLGSRKVIVDSKRRISVDVHRHNIADSIAHRIELLSREGVVVGTRVRNNRVGNGGSTSDKGIVVIPMEFHIRSVPVVKVSGESDFATNANLSLSSRDIDHRKRVNINLGFSSSLATIFIDQRDAEVVRIISILSRERDGILMFASGERGIKSGIVLKPSEGVRSGGLRINVSNHHNVIRVSAANDRISFDSERRVRVDGHGISKRHDRFTTSGRLENRNLINISGRIIIQSVRSLSELGTNSVRDDFTISVPSVDTNSVNARSDSSGEGHRATVAKSLRGRKIVGDSENRIRIDSNSDSIKVNTTITQSKVIQQVSNLHDEVSGIVHSERLIGVRTTSKETFSSQSVLEPLIGQHRIVVVIDSGLQINHTAFTNKSVRSKNVDNRSFINFNRERFTECSTAITIVDFNHIDNRIKMSRLNSLIQQVQDSTGTGNERTISIPIVSSIKVNLTIGESRENHVRIGVTNVITDIMNTFDDDDRVTSDVNFVRSNRNRETARNINNSIDFIHIVCRIVVVDPHLLSKGRTSNERHPEAILFPNVGKSGVNNSHSVIKISSNNDLSTFADLKWIRTISTINGNYGRNNLRNQEMSSVSTSSETASGGLRNFNSEDSRIHVNRRGEPRLSSIRNQSVILVPLESKVRSMIVAKVSNSSHFATRTNGIVIQRNSNENRVSNIHIVRIAGNNTAISILSIDREDVRMILMREIRLENCRVSSQRVDNKGFVSIRISNSLLSSISINSIVVNTPFIVIQGIASSAIGRVINIGKKSDQAVITNERIASNHERRVRENQDRGGKGVLTSFATKLVDSLNCIGVNTDFRNDGDCVKVMTGDFNTILEPTISCKSIGGSFKGKLRTKTDRVTSSSGNDSNRFNIRNRIQCNHNRVRSLASTNLFTVTTVRSHFSNNSIPSGVFSRSDCKG